MSKCALLRGPPWARCVQGAVLWSTVMDDPPNADADAEATARAAREAREQAARAYAKNADANANADATASADANAEAEPGFFQRAKMAPITFGLAAINLAVMLWAENVGKTTDTVTLLQFGAAEPLHVWAGEYWRVATCMFLHIGWIHFAWNTYASVGWCTAIERALGKGRFLFLYLVSGIGAGCLSMATAAIFGPKVSAGASGAMFGIIGATLAIRRRMLPSNAAFFADKGIRSTLIQIGIWTAIGLTALNMDNSAHLGGLITGFAIAWIFTSRVRSKLWPAFAVAMATIGVFAVRPWWAPTGGDANRLTQLANNYFTDWKNPARGERLAEKGCSRGVASACHVLAEHLERTGGVSPKVDELRKRGCDLDPGSCDQVR